MSSPGGSAALLLAVGLSVATAVAVIATTAALKDDMRRTMKFMGNNVVVMAPGSEIEDFQDHANDRPRMSEEAWRRLSVGNWPAIPVRHLIPELRGTLEAKGRSLRIMGVGPEYDMDRELAPTIARGAVVPGSEAARRLGLKEGGELELAGRVFSVKAVAGATGSADDAALRLNLADAQNLLGAGRQITSITGLACKCAGAFLTDAQRKVKAFMPEATVITKMPIARARIRARTSVERFGRILAAAVIALGVLVVMLALWGNVSGRMEEMGTLLAIGARPARLVVLIGWKVVILAAVGAAGGWVAGTVAAAQAAPAFAVMRPGFNPKLLGPAAAVAAAVALVGSIVPLARLWWVDAAEIIREA